MALGTRDIMMIIRARDLSAAALKGVGTNLGMMGTQAGAMSTQMFGIGAAMTTIGVGIGAIGVAGLKFLNDSTTAAMQYNQEAAKTLTQVDNTAIKLEDVKRIAKEVALAIPAPFDEMQTALYDIFSSMDVGLGEAKLLLTEFSRAAVAGQVDLQDASRATIGIMNAYGMEASEVNRVNDVMFQLVRKGVGTYGEFASTIGLSVPAAVRAGQSIETLAGMLAFLTRSGMSASTATAAAGRGLENLTKPKVVERMEAMGIAVKNAAGEYLPMVDIVGQLSEKLKGMTKPEQAKVLDDIFKSAGNNVQARRFWSLAIENFGMFKQRIDDLKGSAGALDTAYETMFGAPQTKMQAMTNAYQVMRVEIGEQLLPIKLALMGAIAKLLTWWNNLDGSTKKIIVTIAGVAAVFMTVAGVVLVVGGAIAMLIAVGTALGVGLTGMIAIIAGVTAALIAIPVIVFLIIKHWGTIKSVGLAVWGAIKDVLMSVWDVFSGFAGFLGDVFMSIWGGITDAWGGVQEAWGALVAAFQAAWSWFSETFGPGFSAIWATLTEEVGAVVSEVVQTFQAMWDFIVGVYNVLQPILSAFFSVFISQLQPFIAAWDLIASTVQMIMGVVVSNIQTALGLIMTIIQTFVGIAVAAWNAFGGTIISLVQTAWNFISSIISAVISVISNTIQFFLNLVQGQWGAAWNNVVGILKAAWDMIMAALRFAFETIKTFFVTLPGNIVNFIGNVGHLLFQKGIDILTGLWNGIKNIFEKVSSWFKDLPGKVKQFFSDAGSWLIEAGKKIMGGLLSGIVEGFKSVAKEVASIPGKIISLKGPPAYDAVFLIDNGIKIMQGLRTGIERGYTEVEKFVGGIAEHIKQTMQATKDMAMSRWQEIQAIAQQAYQAVQPHINSAIGATQSAMANPMQTALNAVTRAQKVAYDYGAPAGTQDALHRVGIMIQTANFGNEGVVPDLDWWAKTQTAGV